MLAPDSDASVQASVAVPLKPAPDTGAQGNTNSRAWRTILYCKMDMDFSDTPPHTSKFKCDN